MKIGRKKKCLLSDDVLRGSSGFPLDEDELVVDIMWLQCALANMERFAYS